jgi:hypothetical protein
MQHLSLENTNIPLSKSVKYLGVVLDDTLTMKTHIHSACRSAFGYLRAIAKNKKSMDAGSLRILIHSLVLSRIEHSSSVLCGYNDLTISPLQMVSNASLRLLAGIRKYDRLSTARQTFGWITVAQRQLIRTACIVYVALKYGRPVYLANLLNPKKHAHATRASNDDLLDIPRTRAKYTDLCFSVIGPRIWNNIPKEIRDSPSLSCFRTKLCRSLLKAEND